MRSTILKNGLVIHADGHKRKDILIENGIISVVGADADLIIINPNDILDNWKDKLVSKSDWSAYGDFKSVFPDKVINTGQLKTTI